jgi:hypothetical protein
MTFLVGGHAQFARIASMTTSGLSVQTLDNTFNPADTDGLSIVCYGAQ